MNVVSNWMTTCLILLNILVSDSVMEDINSRYNLFFSVAEDENGEIEQNNNLVNYSTKYHYANGNELPEIQNLLSGLLNRD